MASPPPPCLSARTGRLRQRYENNLRLVSGCIPYRLAKGNKNTVNRLEVCMVSSPNRNDLVFPKGGWEDDETVHEAACREAVEEAGVRGILNENPLGVWEFRSKSNQELCTLKGGCKGYMFALQVTEELDVWPEQGDRCRKWLNIEEATRLCRYEWMRMALKKFLGMMKEEHKLESEMERSEEAEEREAVVAELHSIAVSDVAECQIVSSSCCVKPSTGSPHRDITRIHTYSWVMPLKRLSLT